MKKSKLTLNKLEKEYKRLKKDLKNAHGDFFNYYSPTLTKKVETATDVFAEANKQGGCAFFKVNNSWFEVREVGSKALGEKINKILNKYL